MHLCQLPGSKLSSRITNQPSCHECCRRGWSLCPRRWWWRDRIHQCRPGPQQADSLLKRSKQEDHSNPQPLWRWIKWEWPILGDTANTAIWWAICRKIAIRGERLEGWNRKQALLWELKTMKNQLKLTASDKQVQKLKGKLITIGPSKWSKQC